MYSSNRQFRVSRPLDVSSARLLPPLRPACRKNIKIVWYSNFFGKDQAPVIGPEVLIPNALAPVHKYWMKFGMALGWVNQRIILSLFCYLVFTPVSIVQMIIKRDPMRRKLSKDVDTYWIDRSQEKPKPKHFERQF